MSQQSEDEVNKINSYVFSNPIGEQQAQSLRRKMMKNMCKFFHPFKQYYQNYPVHYLVDPVVNSSSMNRNLDEKVSLSTEKQMQYLRGTTKYHIDEQLMQKMLQEQMKDRGLVQNHRNKSLLLGSCFIYATEFQIKSVMLKLPNQQSIQKYINCTFAELILQICLFMDLYIVVRCRYWVYIFQHASNKIVSKIRLQQQVTSIAIFESDQQILISTFDTDKYRLYIWNPIMDKLNCVCGCQSFYPVHSMININKRQFILGQSNKIYIEDIRCQSKQTLKRVTQIGNDRFCSIIQIQADKNKIALSKSKYLDIFDIRKSNPSLTSIRHFCEEAPPICLLSFNWLKPVVVAYSPYQLGSSLLFNIQFDKINQQKNKLISQRQSIPSLLFDSGKLFQCLYPKSITPLIIENVINFIHLDSGDGICIETIERDEQSNFRRLRVSNSYKIPQQPKTKWLHQKQIQHYFKKVEDSTYRNKPPQHEQDSDSSQNQNENRKNINYCSLQKFRNRILQLANAPREKQKQNDLTETYASTFNERDVQSSLSEILSYKKKNGKNEEGGDKVNEEVMDFLQQSWKI